MGHDFKVAVIAPSIARSVIVTHHYSKAWPTGNFISFGAFVDKKLCGVVTFGHAANMNNWKNTPGCDKPRDLAELTRLWVADWAPKFIESQAISASLRILRRDKVCKVVVSYADPAQGHIGVVYQASNWVYIGQMPASSQLRFSDGMLMHQRAAFDRFGTNNPGKLKLMDPGIKSEKVPGKHKYLYPVDKALAPKLAMIAKPYPCAGQQRATEYPSVEGGADPTPALHLDSQDG